MHYKLFYPSRYFRAIDIKGKGDVVLTIRRVVRESLRTTTGETKKRAVIYFEETRAAAAKSGDDERRLVAGITVLGQIAEALNEVDADKWLGRKIALFCDQCESFGETVDCIRVRKHEPETANTEAD